MDNSTEYCSFVSVDYIICECGDTFPNEDALKDHLDNDHSSARLDKPTLFDNFIDNKNKTEPREPLVIAEKLPEAEMEPYNNLVYLFDLQGDKSNTEYYLQNACENESIQLLLPEDIKEEKVVLQYVDEDDSYEQNGDCVPQDDVCIQDGVSMQDGVLIQDGDSMQDGYDDQGVIYVQEDGTYVQQDDDFVEENGCTVTEVKEVVVKQEMSEAHPLVGKRVTFKKELADEVIILAEENEEHDYDREASRPVVQEYYFCEVCGKAFISEKTVHTHIKAMHCGKNKSKSSSTCVNCGKTFEMWQRSCSGCGLKRWTKPNSKPRDPTRPKNSVRFTCDVCGVGRSSNAALRYHQRVHTGERPYKCTMCPKAFTMPLFLQLHIRTHTGERPYQCSECPKSFSNQAALVRHNRVHTGVKPYVCPVCDKAFTQSNSMKLHYQTVHLRMPAPYKSQARKLRDMHKVMVLQEPNRRTKKAKTPEQIGTEPRNKLLFRHGFHNREPQLYVVEQVLVDSGEYEQITGQ